MADSGFKQCQDTSRKSVENLSDLNQHVLESPTTEADAGLSLEPVTPDSNRENGDVPFDPQSSPLTFVKKPQRLVILGSNTNGKKITDPFDSTNNSSCSPRTPKDGVFDPFAPGPDDMVLAPRFRKIMDELRSSVARCLTFDASPKVNEDGNLVRGEESLSDDMVFESVYANVLEAIVSNHPGFAQLSSVEWESDGCRTPLLPPHLNGVAETCPPAPVKPSGKSRIIDLGLCRKLEF